MSRTTPLCMFCKRLGEAVPNDDIYARIRYYCEAYPDGDGIPEALYWDTTHFKPKAGDHGLQFTPKNGADKKYIEYLRKHSKNEDKDFEYWNKYYKELDMTDEEWIEAKQKEGMTREEAENSLIFRLRREDEPQT